MCYGRKVRCSDCQQITEQVITEPCAAGSTHRPGHDLRRSTRPQCKGGRSVGYGERTIERCDSCFRKWRTERIAQLQHIVASLEEHQHMLERPYWPSEEAETGSDRRIAWQARAVRLTRADTAIALRDSRRQLNGLQNGEIDDARRGHYDGDFDDPDFDGPLGHLNYRQFNSGANSLPPVRRQQEQLQRLAWGE